MNFAFDVAVLIAIYAVVSMGLFLVSGSGGMLSICQAVFFGFGAYSTGILCTQFQFSWPTTVVVGMALSATVAAALGIMALRLKDDYFVFATFSLQIVMTNTLENWTSLTQGPLGIPKIPPPSILGVTIDTHAGFAVLSGVVLMIAMVTLAQIVRSPFGRVLRAARDDEWFCESAGKSAYRAKLKAFVIGSIVASVGGSLYAAYRGYIDPSSFDVQTAILAIAVVIVSGGRSVLGALVSAGVLVGLPELLRLVGLQSSVMAHWREILYGAVLVAIIVWRPRGAFGGKPAER